MFPNRTVRRRAGKPVTRRTFASHVFSTTPDRPITALKQYLFEAQLTASPQEKLDLVMVQDYEHLTDLVAEHGIPLARSDYFDPSPLKVVTIPRRRYWFLIGAALMFSPGWIVDFMQQVLS